MYINSFVYSNVYLSIDIGTQTETAADEWEFVYTDPVDVYCDYRNESQSHGIVPSNDN